MNNRRIVISLYNMALTVFLFLYFLYRALFDSKFDSGLDTLVLILSVLAGVIVVGLNKTVKSNALVLYLLVGVFISFVFQQFHFSDSRLFMLYLIGLALTNRSETQVTKILFVSRIILILLIFALGGFAQRNGIGSNIGNVALLYMCLYENYFSRKKWCVIFLILATLSVVNPDNSGVLVVLSGVLLLQALRNFEFGKKMLCSKFTMLIYPICLFATWFLSASIRVDKMPLIGSIFPSSFNTLYLNFVSKLNIVLGTRLSLSKTALDKIGLHLLGGDYYTSGYSELALDAANRKAYFMVDSGYILLLLRWGILVTILICTISIIVMKYFIKKRAYNFIIAGIALAFWAILEDSLFYGFILMFWGKALKDLYYMKFNRMVVETHE